MGEEIARGKNRNLYYFCNPPKIPLVFPGFAPQNTWGHSRIPKSLSGSGDSAKLHRGRAPFFKGQGYAVVFPAHSFRFFRRLKKYRLSLHRTLFHPPAAKRASRAIPAILMYDSRISHPLRGEKWEGGKYLGRNFYPVGFYGILIFNCQGERKIFVKQLLSYLKEYRKECVLGPLFKLLEASFELLVPLVMAAIIDVGIENGDRGYIWRMCLLMAGLGLVGLVCSITAQYFAAKASVGFAAKLRRALFSHIQALSFSDLDTQGSSTLITRMTSDINQVQNGLNLALRLLLRSPFVVFGAMVMAFTIDVPGALVFVVTIPLLAAVVFGVMLWTMPRYKQVQAGLDGILSATRENLTGVRVVRAFGREEAEVESFQGKNGALTRLQVHVGRVSALMNPVTYVIINLAAVALLWVGAVRVDGGLLTQGAVVALLNYMSQILVELIKLANLIINIAKALACAGRVQGVLAAKPSMESPRELTGRAQGGARVAFAGVGLTYQGAGAPSLEGLTFSAAPGETVGVIGGTGSGKSSLVNLIPRFYDATQARSWWTAWTCGAIPWRSSGARWGWCPSRPCSLPAPSGRTSGGASQTPPTGSCGRPWRPPRRRNLCGKSPWAWTSPSPREGRTSPGASGSGCALPGPW